MNARRSRCPLVLALPLAVLLALPAWQAHAAERALTIERFSVALDVAHDGSMQVIETLTLAFSGSHQGLVRTIPLHGQDAAGPWTLAIDDVHVLDGDHRPLRTEVTTDGGALAIKAWIPGATDATKTARLLYRVRRAMRAFPDRDELYWNVTGHGWDAWIRQADATVALEGDAPVTARAWTGSAGARGHDYADERAGARLQFRTTRPLRPREGLTILVAWPPGTIEHPSQWRTTIEESWPLALPLLTSGVVLIAWRARGRDAWLGRSIKPEYAPPAGLSPAEGGTLLDQQASPREVIATLVDLAVRGLLEIEPVDGDANDFVVRRVQPLQGGRDLAPLERAILQRILGEDLTLPERALSELREDAHYVFEPIRDEIYRAMVAARLFPTSPFWVRQAWAAAGIVVLFAAGALFVEAERLGPIGPLLALATAASGVILLVASRVMPRRTARGARLAVQLRGFREFLERAEKDRLQRLPPDTLSRWLPWAIALGVSQRWIHRFDGLSLPPLPWYPARGAITLETLAAGLARFERHHAAAITTMGGTSAVAAAIAGEIGKAAGGGMGGGGGGSF